LTGNRLERCRSQPVAACDGGAGSGRGPLPKCAWLFSCSFPLWPVSSRP